MKTTAGTKGTTGWTEAEVAGAVAAAEWIVGATGQVPEIAVAGKGAIVAVLTRAAEDTKFLAALAQEPAQALAAYELTTEEHAALATGDLARIEGWVGKLDERQAAWIWCRLQQEKW